MNSISEKYIRKKYQKKRKEVRKRCQPDKNKNILSQIIRIYMNPMSVKRYQKNMSEKKIKRSLAAH